MLIIFLIWNSTICNSIYKLIYSFNKANSDNTTQNIKQKHIVCKLSFLIYIQFKRTVCGEGESVRVVFNQPLLQFRSAHVGRPHQNYGPLLVFRLLVQGHVLVRVHPVLCLDIRFFNFLRIVNLEEIHCYDVLCSQNNLSSCSLWVSV